MAGSLNVRQRAAWSTFGPHPIGTQRFATVSSGASFAQVAGAILGKQARVENSDKDEVQALPALGSTCGGGGAPPPPPPPAAPRTPPKLFPFPRGGGGVMRP